MATTPLPRGQFPVTNRYVYLNHAGFGALSSDAVQAISTAATSFSDNGGLAYEEYDSIAEKTRATAAQLMGVPTDDVAFVKNTTEGLALVASGIDWKPGDRVIATNLEFPSNVYPWIALRDRGVTVDLIEPIGPRRELPLELFADALRKSPARVVAVSWVQYAYGWRTNLAALSSLCHEHDALLCVDAIQGVGVLSAAFETWGVDVASANSHKWMLGPHGVGVAYVSPRAREHVQPSQPGWSSVRHRDDYENLQLDYDETARRYEGGGINFITIAGMGASLDLLVGAGIDSIWRHVDALCQRLVTGLAELGATVVSTHDGDNRSSIVSFTTPTVTTEQVLAAFEAERVVAAQRAGAVRLSPHAYNTVDEVDAAIAVVRKLV